MPGAAAKPQPARVRFRGSGTSDNELTTFGDHTVAVDSLEFSSEFEAELKEDGTLVPTGTGLLTSGPGTYEYLDPESQVTCSGLIPAAAAGSLPALEVQGQGGGGPQTVLAQSVVGIADGEDLPQYAGCQGTLGGGVPFDASGQAADLVAVLNPYLPGVLTAKATIPAGALPGRFSTDVGSAGAPQQLPGSCAGDFGVPEGDCTMSFGWTGTLEVVQPCGGSRNQITTARREDNQVLGAQERQAAGIEGSQLSVDQTITAPPGGLILQFGDGSERVMDSGSSFKVDGCRPEITVLDEIEEFIEPVLAGPGGKPENDILLGGPAGIEAAVAAPHESRETHRAQRARRSHRPPTVLRMVVKPKFSLRVWSGAERVKRHRQKVIVGPGQVARIRHGRLVVTGARREASPFAHR